MLFGCSPDEIIRVGTPFHNNGTDGVKFHDEITDTETITSLRTLIKNAKDIEEPNDLTKEPEVFFSLDKPKEGISEIRRYIWYQDDGSAVLYNEATGYSILTKKQTIELKNILKH